MLKDKKAIITGGSQGIGRGIAFAMAQAGADVLVQYRTSKKLAEENCKAIRSMGKQAYSLQADFIQEEDTNNFNENHDVFQKTPFFLDVIMTALLQSQ